MGVVFLDCKYLYQAKKMAPWAEFFMKCYGGYWAFENRTDYEIYKAQK